jgi:hypothetical protein
MRNGRFKVRLINPVAVLLAERGEVDNRNLMEVETMPREKKMRKPERAKLAKAFPVLMREMGFTETPNAMYRWKRETTNRNAGLLVSFHFEENWAGHPWLATRFERPYRRPDLPWDAPENHATFGDLNKELGANPYTGKFNTDLPILRADECLLAIRAFLSLAIGDMDSYRKAHNAQIELVISRMEVATNA